MRAKHYILAIKPSKLFYLVLSPLLLFSANANAQHKYRELFEPKELSPAKGIQETYTRYDLIISNTILHVNTKYNEDDIRAKYPFFGSINEIEGTFQIRVESNERLLNSVRSVFSPQRIKQLASMDEEVIMELIISQLGEPLMISFSISSASLITIEEVERLEKELLNNLVFITYDSTVKGNASTPYYITFSFQEVIDGRVDVSWSYGSRRTWD